MFVSGLVLGHFCFLYFVQHDTQNHDVWTPFRTQLGPKWRSKYAKCHSPHPPKKKLNIYIIIKKRTSPFIGGLGTICFPNRFRLICLRFCVVLWSIWGFRFATLLDWLMGLLLFWAPFVNRILHMFFHILFLTNKVLTKTWRELPRSAKIKRDQQKERKI